MKFETGDKVRVRGHSVGRIMVIVGPLYTVYITDSTGGYSLTCYEADLSPISEPLPHVEKETTAKPARYNSGKGLEVWDAIDKLGADYMQGNVIKYTMRYKHKNKAEDLKKAMNYLAKMLAEETGEDYYALRKKTLDEL